MAQKIRNFYFGERAINGSTIEEFSNLVSDVTFNYGVNRAIRLHASGSSGKTFYYKFSVDGRFNWFKLSLHAHELKLPGATHADDVFYTFG